MRVSKTRQHGSYRRVTELHLTQFPVYIISSRGETSDQSQPTTTPMFAFTFWLFRRLKTRFANRRPELFIPLGFFEDRFIPLFPPSLFFLLPPLPTRFKRHRGKSRSVSSSVSFPRLSFHALIIPLHCVSLDLLEFVDVIWFILKKWSSAFFFPPSFFLHAYIVRGKISRLCSLSLMERNIREIIRD